MGIQARAQLILISTLMIVGMGLTWDFIVQGLMILITIVLAFLHKSPQPIKSVPVRKIDPQTSQDLPIISVIICAKNEENVLREALQSILLVDYPSDKLDVWIINDASTDKTEEIIQEFKNQYSHIQSIFRKSSEGFKAGALNSTFKLIKGNFVALFDADARIPNDIFTSTISLFDDPNVGGVEIKKSCYNKCQNYLTRLIHDEYIEGTKNLSGGGVIIRKKSWEDTSGWNEECLTEDFEMTYQLLNKNWKIIFPAQPIIEIEAPSSLMNFIKQRYRWLTGDLTCILENFIGILLHSFSEKKSEFEAFSKQLVMVFISLFTFEFFILSLYEPKFFIYTLFIPTIYLFIETKNSIMDENFSFSIKNSVKLFFNMLLKLHLFIFSVIAFFRITLRKTHTLKWAKFTHKGADTNG